MSNIIRPIDREGLQAQYRSAKPFPYIKIDDFLEEEPLQRILAAYPTYEEARRVGREFDAVNEKLKIQVTDSAQFPPPVKLLADALSSEGFLSDLEFITGIPRLVADPKLQGGGMHLTSSTGRLDVHVDFNYNPDTELFRRLNILVYLNPRWEAEWGGEIELWDRDVQRCEQSFPPILNRCIVFETSEFSFHGVTPVKCPPGVARKSFAAYYYTREAPPWWDGSTHSTIFKARPDERLRGTVLMPMEQLYRRFGEGLKAAKRAARKVIGP
jgi:2OG-Fe(II) oxygenase superfamily